MATNYGTLDSTQQTFARRKNSYSLKRWSGFDAWQEHVRKSAALVGEVFKDRHDRDLKRVIVSG